MTATLHTQTQSAAQTAELGYDLGQYVQSGDIIILSGDLGAGKTQFAAALAQGLDIDESITSPTFALMKRYLSGRIPLYHLDLYRLDRPEQLDDLDFWDLVALRAAVVGTQITEGATDMSPDAAGVVLIEWGDIFEQVTQHADLSITLRISGRSERNITLQSLSQRGAQLLADLQQKLQEEPETGLLMDALPPELSQGLPQEGETDQ
ncbi:MAG: tRNA (adenosine(37)-N6)-threonylcarbamoyltransferase complex ATPase subunit type 1 TsaE [Coriobacteriia bacterium]|nr:tRNA (adenosine(37)-N6)-threonylcarbamoyltransferase complex ATPase subunit type 1 TsaE [Coriobacteriia bacterium]